MLAAYRDRADIVGELADHGADPNLKNENGETALASAAQGKSFVCTRYLLNRGAKVDVQDVSGTTPLMYAAMSGSTEVVSLLMTHGADCNHRNAKGNGPLSFAAWAGQDSVVELLLDHGSSLDSPDHPDASPLLRASMRGRTLVIRRLLNAGADPRKISAKGWTPLHVASQQGWATVAAMLLAAGADPNARGEGGRTPLIFATAAGHRNVAKVLYSHGADPTIEATDGKEPRRAVELPSISRPPEGQRASLLSRALLFAWRVGWGLIVALFSKQHTIEGVEVGMLAVPEKHSTIAFRRIHKALQLIAQYDPSKFRRLRRDVRRIQVTSLLGTTGMFSEAARTCFLDGKILYGDKSSVTAVACTIVHEATHARQFSVGFCYSEADRLRIERACVRAEVSFVRSIPGEDSTAWAEEKKLGALDAGLLSNAAMAERQVRTIQEDIRVGWLARFGEWMIRRRSTRKQL
jgi:ankyrin repeat protein